MSPSYRIEIIAEGQHHLGHTTGNPDKDADNLMKMFLPALEKHGHKITFAAFHHGETTDILVGTPDQIRPTPVAPAAESPVLNEIHANVNSLVGKVDGLTKLVKNATKPAPDPKLPQPPKKIEGGVQEQETAADADKASQASQSEAPKDTTQPPEKKEGSEA